MPLIVVYDDEAMLPIAPHVAAYRSLPDGGWADVDNDWRKLTSEELFREELPKVGGWTGAY